MNEQQKNTITNTSQEDRFLKKELNVPGIPIHLEERLIQSYLTVILRYKGLITLVALIVITAVIYLTLRIPKQYTAHTVIGMGSYMPSSEIALARMLRADMQSDVFIQNQLTMLSSLGIATRALRKDPEIAKYLVGPEELPADKRDKNGNLIPPEFSVELLKKYLSHTSYELLRGSTMVRIMGHSTSPEIAAKVANAQAAAFVELTQSQLLEAANINMNVLYERLKEKRRAVEKKNRALKRFVKKYASSLTKAGAGNDVTDMKLRNLVNALGSAVISRATAEAQLRELRSSRTLNGLGLDSGGRSKYTQLQKDLEDYRLIKQKTRNPNHRWLREKRQAIDMTRTELKLSLQQKLLDAEITYRANLEREALLQGEFDELKGELRNKESDRAEQARIQLEYGILQAEVASAKLIYEGLARRMEEARLVTNKEQLTVKIVDEAIVPTFPSSPNVKFNILMGLVFGPLLGIALAYMLAFIDNSIRTTEQVVSALGVKVMGVIPSFSRKIRSGYYGQQAGDKHTGKCPVPEKSSSTEEESYGKTVTMVTTSGRQERHVASSSFVSNLVEKTVGLKKGEIEASSSETLLLEAPYCLEAEAFRSLRTMVAHSFKGYSSKVLLATSGQPLDGKTTTISNLAISFGQTGKKTVLIDTDVRKATLHNRFGLPDDQPGLREYLTGKCKRIDIIAASPIESLSLISAGHAEMSPGELLASEKMEKLVKTLSEEFEFVLMDSPPLSCISDALLLSKFSDGVLLVVRSGQTPRPVAEHAISRLRQIDAPIIGTVLNDIKAGNSYGNAEYYYLRGSYNSKYVY